MKRICTYIAIMCICGCFPVRVYAHTLKVDRNIGINIHVDPDDAPAAGEESNIYIDIEDKTGRFNVNNPENCTCLLTVYKNNIAMHTIPVTVGGRYNRLRYTFPEAGTYTLKVSGTPKGSGVPFQEFAADFEYYVRGDASGNNAANIIRNPMRDWAPYIAVTLGSALVLMFVLL